MRSDFKTAPSSGIDRFPITGIFFQRPTVDKYGVLYIHTKSDNYTGNLEPDASDIRVPGIVNFEVVDLPGNLFNNFGNYPSDVDLNGQYVVAGALIKIVVRNYFGNKLDDLKWCPPAFLTDPACQSPTPFKDTEKVFLINLRDNILSRGVSQRGSDPASTSTFAPEYRRSADTVYFLKPSFPMGVSR